MMTVMEVEGFGGPEALVPVQKPVPTPGEGEVLIEQRAIGVNFVDLQHRSGTPYPLSVPFVPGIEASGMIVEIGAGVSSVRLGQAVAYGGPMPGAYSPFVTIDAALVIPLPEGLGFDDAAAVTLQGMTAHYLSHDAHKIMPGESVFIHAASGGVGGFLIDYAKAIGAFVIGGTSDPSKLSAIKARGADHAVLITTDRLADDVLALSNGGVHVVYDSLGGPYFDIGLKMLRARGSNVVYGLAAGQIPPVDIGILSGFYGTGNKGSIRVSWTTLGDHTATPEALVARAHAVYSDAQTGVIKARIGAILPLADASQAHRAFSALSANGKIILHP